MNYSPEERAALGRDLKGRSRAQNAVQAKGGAGIFLGCLLVIIRLLVLPAIAGQRRGVNFRWVGAYAIVMSAVTYWAYASDKRRAQEGEWRVSEARLHLLELLGGWPGAFLAQRRLRHKCSKGSYQGLAERALKPVQRGAGKLPVPERIECLELIDEHDQPEYSIWTAAKGLCGGSVISVYQRRLAVQFLSFDRVLTGSNHL
jgi:uncharacterized membrane protein YsdA (DUF1294 family)